MKVLLVGFSLMFSCAIVSFSTDAWSPRFIAYRSATRLTTMDPLLRVVSETAKEVIVASCAVKNLPHLKVEIAAKNLRENYIRKKAR